MFPFFKTCPFTEIFPVLHGILNYVTIVDVNQNFFPVCEFHMLQSPFKMDIQSESAKNADLFIVS